MILLHEREMSGLSLTIMLPVGSEEHVLLSNVKVKLTVPPETPITYPSLVTVASDGLLLCQVPPVVGESCVEPPSQMTLPPVILTEGFTKTVNQSEGIDLQPVEVSV